MSEVGGITKLFADDLKRYSMAENSKSVQTGLDKISTWCSDWQLTLAPAKCCCLKIICSSKHDNSDDDRSDLYNLGGQSIPFVRETRDLGVLVDNHLSFSGHIQQLVKRNSEFIYFLNVSLHAICRSF